MTTLGTIVEKLVKDARSSLETERKAAEKAARQAELEAQKAAAEVVRTLHSSPRSPNPPS